MSTGWTTWPGTSGGIYSSVTNFGHETFETARANAVANSHDVFPLGGSLSIGIDGTSYVNAIDFVPFRIPATKFNGFTWIARVWMVCQDASVTITPRIYNLTDSAVVVTGSVCSGVDDAAFTGTNQKQDLSFSPVNGKDYVLQFVKSANTHWCAGIGSVIRTDS